MDVITLVNRSSKPVQGTWDGKPYIIQPKQKQALPVVVGEAIKRQNVVMGSEDPYTGEMEYLVGIVEYGDDITPIEQTNSITRMNRKALNVKDETTIAGKNGLYSGRDLAPGLPVGGPVAGTFVKP